jgi:lysozyme
MKTVCAKGELVKGIDISHWQPNVDFVSLRNQGFLFAFIKASEHLYRDQMFHNHWTNAKNAGVIVGAYHYFHPSEDPVKQAQYFAKTVGPLAVEDMPCAMDWETTDGVPSETDLDRALTFLQTLEKLTHKTPIIYTSAHFTKSLQPTTEFADYPLWVAHWGVRCPLIGEPWDNWTFWQTNDHSKVAPGDVDVFNGAYEDLILFCKTSAS